MAERIDSTLGEHHALLKQIGEQRALLKRIKQGRLEGDDFGVMGSLLSELIEEMERSGQEEVVIEVESSGAKMAGSENIESRGAVVRDGSRTSTSQPEDADG